MADFKLEPPDEETTHWLRQMSNSAGLKPAEERYVRFYLRQKLDKVASHGGKVMQPDPITGEPKEVWVQGAGRPVHKSVEYVEILCPGDKDTVIDRPANKVDRYAWPNKYTAFRNGLSQDNNGVPLETWGGLPPERVADFKAMRISTVEQLADIPDGNLSGLGMHARSEREKAREYLAVMKGNAPLAELKAENSKLQERLAALEKLAAQSEPKNKQTKA